MIFINDLPDRILSMCKIFAHDTSVAELNTDLEKISQRAYQWKMQLNRDPSKQANEIIFSHKLVSNNLLHPLLVLTIMMLLDVLIKKIYDSS